MARFLIRSKRSAHAQAAGSVEVRGATPCGRPPLAPLCIALILVTSSGLAQARETISRQDPGEQSYDRGKRLLEEGRYEEAATAFQAVISAPAPERLYAAAAPDVLTPPVRSTTDPPSAPQGLLRRRLRQWHAQQAAAALAQQEYLAAVAHARRAIELDPTDRQSRQLLANAQKAFDAHKRLAAKRAAFVQQARVAEQRGDDQRAAAVWKRVLRLDPDDPEAKEGVARATARWRSLHPPIKRARELTTTSTTRAPATEEYRISIGDVLEVFVWQQPDLSRDVVVRPDGRISFPLVGDLPAVNATLTDLDNLLTEKLKTYVKYPDVSLAIKRFGGTKTILLGEVGRPGIYVPTGDGRALDVIAMAGGFMPRAAKRDVLLIRGGLASPQMAKLNLDSVLTHGDLEENVVLQPNDILFVAQEGKTAWGSVKEVLDQLSPLMAETLVFQAVATNFGAREFQRTGRSTGVE